MTIAPSPRAIPPMLCAIAIIQMLAVEALVIATRTDGYNRVDRYVSELGGPWFPLSWATLMDVSILVASLALIALAAWGTAARLIPGAYAGIMVSGAAGGFLIALFPLSGGSPLHGIGANALFSLLPVALVLSATAATYSVPRPWLRAVVGILGVVGFLGFTLHASMIPIAGGLGLTQRLAVYPSLLGAVALCALLAGSRPRGGLPRGGASVPPRGGASVR
ncbi:DUF998 domain-containing protein [Lolliginicoccus levis]|uniref:DUF998 domain-containing protein n=1 Tax=Lolliginicoccus levis TaxID=2919542 RepID=UPI00241FB760|nr:DUF998 domain-containing protein [Lolliginicoccus levis]